MLTATSSRRARPGEGDRAGEAAGALAAPQAPAPAGERAVADRHLDEAVAQLGGDDGQHEAQHERRVLRQRLVDLRPGVHEDRPVPQVQRVRAHADPHERRLPEHAGRARCPGARRRRSPRTWRPTARRTRPGRGTSRSPRIDAKHPMITPTAPSPARSSDTDLTSASLAERVARLPQQGQGGAEQQARRPGVGAVVGPAGVDGRLEQHGHPHQRGDGAGGDEPGDRRGRGPGTGAACRAAGSARGGRTAPRSPATTGAGTPAAARPPRSTTGRRRSGTSSSRTSSAAQTCPASFDGVLAVEHEHDRARPSPAACRPRRAAAGPGASRSCGARSSTSGRTRGRAAA